MRLRSGKKFTSSATATNGLPTKLIAAAAAVIIIVELTEQL